jgi:hypothetical protein
MQLLLACARRELGAEHKNEIRAAIRSGLDWERVLSLSLQHKMLPLLWWHLRSEAASIPEPAVAHMRRLFAWNAQRMLQLSGELLEIVRLFAANGIGVVPYKGPALGVYLYGNLALRQAGDLDLLVSRRHVARARELLVQRGYQPRHALAPGAEEFMARSRYGETLERENGPEVELHWAFTNGDVALPLDYDVVEPNLRTVAVGGGHVRLFGSEDMLLILCVHGSKHRWDRLEWLCGVAELLRAHSAELNWNAALDRAAAIGARRMLLLGVLLAHELLNAPVPLEIIRLAEADRRVTALAREVPKLFLAETVDGDQGANIATDLFRLHLRERPRDRLRFIWYRITTPSRPESWSAVPVGGHWLPLHAFYRPVRLLSKLIPALRSYFRISRRSV